MLTVDCQEASCRHQKCVPWPLSQEDIRAAFSAWAAHNEKAYASQQEFTERLGVWTANVQRQLGRTNAAEVAVNGLADLTTDEFRAAYLGYVPRSSPAAELRCDALHCACADPAVHQSPLVNLAHFGPLGHI